MSEELPELEPEYTDTLAEMGECIMNEELPELEQLSLSD